MPEYLKTESSKTAKVIDYRDWQIPLGRRFRSLKLWAVIRYYGIDGLQNYVRNHIELTQEFLSWIKNDKGFEVIAPTPLNLVCFRARGSDRINEFKKLLTQYNGVEDKPHGFYNFKNIDIIKSYVGRYATSMEMAGMSITTLKLSDNLKKNLFAKSECPFWNN